MFSKIFKKRVYVFTIDKFSYLERVCFNKSSKDIIMLFKNSGNEFQILEQVTNLQKKKEEDYKEIVRNV